jgi:hypothetical protein
VTEMSMRPGWRRRDTDGVSKQSVRVDVTDEFPFLVTKMSPCYDR